VFILVLFAVFVFTAPGFVEQYSHPERFGLAPFFASLFLVHNWGIGEVTRWNVPTWSLRAEWLAYLAFPLVTICVSKVKASYSLFAALLALVVLEVVIFVFMMPREGTGKIGLLRIGFEFLAGCLVYRYAAWPRRKTVGYIEWVAIAMLLVAIYVPTLRPFASTSFALLILAVVSGPSAVSAILSSRPLLFLGDVSFSLYMCHSPLIQVRNWAVNRGLIGEEAALALLIVSICLASVFCWKYVETPARSLGRKLLNKPSAAPVKAGMADIPHQEPATQFPNQIAK
jgi:peptidoglycan/LPS O-acetylase OafA/YrhL